MGTEWHAHAPTVETKTYGTIKLFEHQIPHAHKLTGILQQYQAAIDTSDTGTGKTFTALAVAADLKLYPIVICPKAVIPAWEDTISQFRLTGFVRNYEQYTRGNTSFYRPLRYTEDAAGKPIGEWELPPDALLIWDEAHYIKSGKTKRGRMARYAIKKAYNLYLSATIANKIQDIETPGIALNVFGGTLMSYLLKHGCWQDRFYNWHTKDCEAFWNWPCTCNDVFSMVKNVQQILYSADSPRASRMSRSQIKNLPALYLNVKQMQLLPKEQKAIEKAYAEREKILADKVQEYRELQRIIAEGIDQTEEKLMAAKLRGEILAEYTHARRIAEYHKIQEILNMTHAEIAAGSSIVIFLSFKESAIQIASALTAKHISTGLISGQLTGMERSSLNKDVLTDRPKVIEYFRADKLRAVVCTIAAGGVGISLHDINGKYPRLAIINYDWSAVHLRQAVGRVSRVGAKTLGICWILYVRNTIEEKMAKKLQEKLDVIDVMNNDVQEKIFNKEG